MCIVCAQESLGKLTPVEAIRNLGEMIDGAKNEKEKEHYLEVVDKMIDKQFASTQNDADELVDDNDIFYIPGLFDDDSY